MGRWGARFGGSRRAFQGQPRHSTNVVGPLDHSLGSGTGACFVLSASFASSPRRTVGGRATVIDNALQLQPLHILQTRITPPPCRPARSCSGAFCCRAPGRALRLASRPHWCSGRYWGFASSRQQPRCSHRGRCRQRRGGYHCRPPPAAARSLRVRRLAVWCQPCRAQHGVYLPGVACTHPPAPHVPQTPGRWTAARQRACWAPLASSCCGLASPSMPSSCPPTRPRCGCVGRLASAGRGCGD